MKRIEPCTTCGEEVGAMAFANDPQCSDFCKKWENEEVTTAQYESLTGRRYNHHTHIFDQFPASKLLTNLRERR